MSTRPHMLTKSGMCSLFMTSLKICCASLNEVAAMLGKRRSRENGTSDPGLTAARGINTAFESWELEHTVLQRVADSRAQRGANERHWETQRIILYFYSFLERNRERAREEWALAHNRLYSLLDSQACRSSLGKKENSSGGVSLGLPFTIDSSNMCFFVWYYR